MLSKLQLYGMAGLFVLLLMGSTYVMYKQNVQLRADLKNQVAMAQNNDFASMDSLRKYVSENGQAVYEKLGYVYDLAQKQNSVLSKQGLQLQTLQQATVKLQDIVSVQHGQVNVNDSTASITFSLDTSIVRVTGISTIDLKHREYSFTKLLLAFKQIPLKLGISKDKNGHIVGSATSTLPGVEISTLETQVNPDVYSSVNVKQEQFFDLVRLGALLGFRHEIASPVNKVFAYGLTAEYKGQGLWWAHDRYGNTYLLHVSLPLSTILGH